MASSTPDPRRWWALAIIAVAQFVVIMDTSIIGVALPEIQRALQFSQPDLSWVFNAYVIAFGGLLLLGGRLADLYGARRVFMAGFAILGGASLITGLAPSDSVLLAGRALQGVGSALIAPAALDHAHDPLLARPPGTDQGASRSMAPQRLPAGPPGSSSAAS